MRKALFTVVCMVLVLTSGKAFAENFEIEVSKSTDQLPAETAICDELGGLCLLSYILDDGSTLEIEARFHKKGEVNFMFLYNGNYLNVNDNGDKEHIIKVDGYFGTKEEVILFVDPADADEEFLGIKMPDSGRGARVADLILKVARKKPPAAE